MVAGFAAGTVALDGQSCRPPSCHVDVRTDAELRMAVLELGVDMFEHGLSMDPQLAMHLVNVDKRTVDLLVLEPNHLEDGSSRGSSQAGNITAVREYHSNGTRHYTAVDDRTGEVLREITIHDLPGYTFRMFMVDEGD